MLIRKDHLYKKLAMKANSQHKPTFLHNRVPYQSIKTYEHRPFVPIKCHNKTGWLEAELLLKTYIPAIQLLRKLQQVIFENRQASNFFKIPIFCIMERFLFSIMKTQHPPILWVGCSNKNGADPRSLWKTRRNDLLWSIYSSFWKVLESRLPTTNSLHPWLKN